MSVIVTADGAETTGGPVGGVALGGGVVGDRSGVDVGGGGEVGGGAGLGRPAARVVCGQVMADRPGRSVSLTWTLVSVTLPELVTSKL